MKSVLISIQPKWCELIASRKKTVEVRKTKPNIETPFKVYIYCTKHINEYGTNLVFYEDENGMCYENGKSYSAFESGKVIGEFVCRKIDTYPYNKNGYGIMQEHLLCTLSCIEEKELYHYLQGAKPYAWNISNLVIYDKPKGLSEFVKPCKYRNDDGSCRYMEVECDCVRFDFNPDYSVNLAECWDYMSRPPQSWCYVERKEDEGE